MATCYRCNGSCVCQTCNGEGKIRPGMLEALGTVMTLGLLDDDDNTCGSCNGSTECSVCNGTGEI